MKLTSKYLMGYFLWFISTCLMASFPGPQYVYGQTTVSGKILSVDGTPITNVVISITDHSPRDIFRETYEDVYAGHDGSYEVTLMEPGIFTLTVKGVYHRTLSIPVLIYDQEEMEMNVLALPVFMNTGQYFNNPEYLEWIRVVGNFNNYSFEDGVPFHRNEDGSISAIVPVTSDTLRFYVRGLTYGSGATPLPPADRYELTDDNLFESVLYSNLPKDSLEIKYTPGYGLPYNLYMLNDANPLQIPVRGFISFSDERDIAWVKPLVWIRSFQDGFYWIDSSDAEGLTRERVLEYMAESVDASWFSHDYEKLTLSEEWLSKDELHPQQHALFVLAYVDIWERRENFRNIIVAQGTELDFPEAELNMGIINSITTRVTPVHPVWSRNNRMPEYLLKITDYSPEFRSYFADVVRYHSDGEVVKSTAIALISYYSDLYENAEDVPVFQIVLDRYGESHLVRTLYTHFNRINR